MKQLACFLFAFCWICVRLTLADGWHNSLWIAQGIINVLPSNNEDSAETKAFIDAIRSTDELPSGQAGGVSFDWSVPTTIGIAFGASYTEFSIEETIDPEETPEDISDDLFVKSAARTTQHSLFFLNTAKFLTLGIGTDLGSFDFNVSDANGISETRTFSFRFSYAHVSLSTAYLNEDNGPYISIFSNFVTPIISTLTTPLGLPESNTGNFSANTFGIILGVIF